MGKHAKLKEKQEWSEEKLHLENARKLRGIYFIDPEDKEFKETIKNARKKLETSIAPAMPVEFAESGCPIFRATTPLSRGQLKSKGHGKLSIHHAADQETIETIFRIIVSANQLSLYGAVAEICEEYESLHERTGRPVVMGQSSSSLVLSAIQTEVPLDNDDPAYKIFRLPLILIHIWPDSTLLRGHLALATLSTPETDPQILEHWGYAVEDHLDKLFQAMDSGLDFLRDVQQLS